MALGRPLGAKVFLEGKEVPLIGATITSSVNQASIAYIDLVPQAEINNIKPRTHVEIAVRDYNNIEEDFPYVTAWEGEVFGYSFNKEVSARSFSVSAIDVSSYWDNVLSYFFNTNVSLGKGGMQQVPMGLDYQTAQAQGYRINATVGGADVSYFARIIEEELTKKRADGTPSDFLDALVAVYKNITDINDFYNAAELKLRIRDRIVLKSSGALDQLIKSAEAKKWFSGIIDRSGGFTSLRQVVQNLLSIIFHDFVPMPFPAKVQRDNLEGDALKSSDKVQRTVGSFVLKPSLYMVAPPMCNVFFPDEYSQFTFNRNFFREPTRLIYKPEMPIFRSGEPLALRYVYEPPSFDNFMQGKQPWSNFRGGDLGVTGEPGLWGDAVSPTDPSADLTGSKRKEGQFLTNEERIKGIWMEQESMIPINTEFQGSSLTDITKKDFAQKIAKYLFYKKRFEGRPLQITSHLKMSVAPGFPVLLLDDSDAQQNVVAYCTSVTHRIYATQGGYTNVALTYARSVDEQEASTGDAGEPLVPAFYASEVFGTSADVGPVLNPVSNLSKFYEAVLGSKGSKPVTDYSKDAPALSGAVDKILADYRTRRESGAEDVQAFIADLTGRDYVRLRDSMGFKGATTKTADLRADSFTDFKGGAFNPENSTFGDALKTRLVPIDLYRTALMSQRGFRG